MTTQKGVANLPQDEYIKTYPLRSLFLVLCDNTVYTYACNVCV